MMQQDVLKYHSMVHSDYPMIGTDFLLSRLNQDWDEFRTRGRAALARLVPPANRQKFGAAFEDLVKKGCHSDILFLCIYVFLNSRPSDFLPWTRHLKFPSSEKWQQIRDGLDRVRSNMNALVNTTALATLEAEYWDLDLEEFSSFRVVHDDLLGTMERYKDEIDDLRRVLPKRKEIVKQYGQTVIWTYVSDVTKLPPDDTSSVMQTLLGLFYRNNPEEGDIPEKWKRDIERFQKAYPAFYLSVKSFLTEKHLSSVKLPLPAPDWKGFVKNGRL